MINIQREIYKNAKKIYKNLDIENRLDWRDNVLNISDEFIVNNFIVKSIDDWGIINSKNEYKGRTIYSSPVTKNGAWLGENWLLSYQKYCDQTFILPLKYRWKQDLRVEKSITKLNKHFAKFWMPIKNFYKWLFQPLSILYYIVKIIIIFAFRFYKLFK